MAAAPGVTSPRIKPGEAIPLAFSTDDASPPLAWAGAPEGTRSFALVLDDPDSANAKPFTHWLAYNIPPNATSLREGIPDAPLLQEPRGFTQGRNTRGSIGYTGMKPPVGDPPHRYHVQVFALDRTLDLKPGASRAEVLAAMKGHVLAPGELVGTFERKPGE